MFSLKLQWKNAPYKTLFIRVVLLLTFYKRFWGLGYRWPLKLCLCLCLQRAAEGSPILLCAWCDWWAEQPSRPHHNTGAWFSSWPGHWPLSGTQEWGMSTQSFRSRPELHIAYSKIYTFVLPKCCMQVQGDVLNAEMCQHFMAEIMFHLYFSVITHNLCFISTNYFVVSIFFS